MERSRARSLPRPRRGLPRARRRARRGCAAGAALRLVRPGPEVDAFENEFAAYVGTAHAVGVASGLDALTLALRALDIGPGDEVVVPSNAYVACWLAVSAVGATIVPVEPDAETCALDAARGRAAIGPRTAAVMGVHLYGRAAVVAELRALCDRTGSPWSRMPRRRTGRAARARRARRRLLVLPVEEPRRPRRRGRGHHATRRSPTACACCATTARASATATRSAE